MNCLWTIQQHPTLFPYCQQQGLHPVWSTYAEVHDQIHGKQSQPAKRGSNKY